MRLIRLAWANLTSKPLNTLLSVLLLAFGVGIISLLLVLENEVKQKFERNIKDIDMVVGAKGSPTQLILSSVYHVGAPTGNIPMRIADRLKRQVYVEKTIPLSYGDNYSGYRIVGTTPAYLEHYEVEFAQGTLWEGSMEAVVGSDVAEALQVKLGDTFASNHGLDAQGETHEDQIFTVSGILKKSYSVVDQLILTDLQSVWDVHGEHAEDDTTHVEEKEITALLVTLRNPAGQSFLPAMLREDDVQIVATAIEVNKLTQGFGIGADTLKYLAYAIIFLSSISLFISLYNSLKERRYELAIMRTMGGTSPVLFSLVLMEGIIITLLGIFLGLILSRVGLSILSSRLQEEFHYDLSSLSLLPLEWILVGGMLLIGILASLLPAIQAIRLDISKTLSDE